MSNIRRLDLNLLVTLDALLTERNATRAAQRLNFSQPTISVHLAKLRTFFDDPLLLPGPRGMHPTVKAEALREPLRAALMALEQTISPSAPFDPASATNIWRLAASDYSESAILQPILMSLRSSAPETRLAVLNLTPARVTKQAEHGDIDLAFHTRTDAPPGLHSRTLFTERYVLVGRSAHPHLTPGLTLERFCQLEHIIVSPDGGGFHAGTDEALAKLGLSRKVVLSLPHFLFVKSLLTDSDLVAMLPSRLIQPSDQLVFIEPPLEVEGFEMLMLWHERSHHDPAHQWLRNFIAETV